MNFRRSTRIQEASLHFLKQRKQELRAKQRKAPLMHTKSHFLQDAPLKPQEIARKSEANVTLSVADGFKLTKGPLSKIFERFILLTESKNQIFGKITFEGHGNATSSMNLSKVLKFCEHFGFLDNHLVTRGEVASLFAKCTQIHSSAEYLLTELHCEEFLQQKRMVNAEFQLPDFLIFMVRLATLVFSRPPLEPNDELQNIVQKVNAFISHFRLNDSAHVQSMLDKVKEEHQINKAKGAFLKAKNGILHSIRSNFEGLNNWENHYMESFQIGDDELKPFLDILIQRKTDFRDLPSNLIDAKGLRIGFTYRYKVTVLNDEMAMKDFNISTDDTHVLSISESVFSLAPGMSKSFFVSVTPIGCGRLNFKVNDLKIPIYISI